MKKYLFLLFLFIVYLLLIIRNNTLSKPVVYYDKKYKNGVCDLTLEFNNGINSKDIDKLFSNYNNEYYIYSIGLKDKEIKLSCDNISNCLKSIFDQEDNVFGMLNINNGFRINKINFITDKEKIIKYLNANEIVYEIK